MKGEGKTILISKSTFGEIKMNEFRLDMSATGSAINLEKNSHIIGTDLHRLGVSHATRKKNKSLFSNSKNKGLERLRAKILPKFFEKKATAKKMKKAQSRPLTKPEEWTIDEIG